MSTLLCLGFGYSARALAAELEPMQWQVTGTSRTGEGAQAITNAGFTGVVCNESTDPEAFLAQCPEVAHVLVSAAPDADGDPFLKLFGRKLAELPGLQWVGYLSTVGVYGDHGGAWVDEDTVPRPVSERSVRRVAAERQWDAFASQTGCHVEIFRLSGIYGPGLGAARQTSSRYGPPDREARTGVQPHSCR